MINYRVEIVKLTCFTSRPSRQIKREISQLLIIFGMKNRRAEIVMTSVLELQKRRTLSLSLAVDTT
jgi:hypothetical protein